MSDAKATIEAMEIVRKEGALCRDTPGAVNPYAAGTVRNYVHMQGWLQRDLQLCLCRASPLYRNSQIASGSITEEGIAGGYGFDRNNKLVA